MVLCFNHGIEYRICLPVDTSGYSAHRPGILVCLVVFKAGKQIVELRYAFVADREVWRGAGNYQITRYRIEWIRRDSTIAIKIRITRIQELE